MDLIQDATVVYTCREHFSAFAFPARAFYEIADFKIESAFESIFVGQIIHFKPFVEFCNLFARHNASVSRW